MRQSWIGADETSAQSCLFERFTNATKVNGMFRGCSSLSGLPDGFSCPSATGIYRMFYSCYVLSGLPEGFNCQSATNTEQMFASCSGLSALPDGFSCPDVTDAEYMFNGCASLTRIGYNVKIANWAEATGVDNTDTDKSRVTSIGDNFGWFTNAVFEGDWDPSLGLRNVFPNTTHTGSGWRVYQHYDGE